MIRLFFYCFFLTSITLNGQSLIQHEPERIYSSTLPEDYSKVDIQKQGIKEIIFFRDSTLSSSIEYDQLGNRIKSFGMENNSVRMTLTKYDSLNREIERKHFDTAGLYNHGYYFLYTNGIKGMYKINDSLLLQENSFNEDKTIEIATRYNDNGDISFEHITHYDNKGNFIYESRFNGNRKNVDYKYEWDGNKKFITKIQYDKKGDVSEEYRYLDEEVFPNENKVSHYTTDEQYIFRVDSLDSKERLVKMILMNEESIISRIEENNYNSNGQFINISKRDLIREKQVDYSYEYDSNVCKSSI
ncbi:hypothetical protein N9Q47_05260 [Vicingaceae bacterium]|nr:hypothetical protein [Vicingaceae bacterium]